MYHSINKMLSPHPFVSAGAEDSMKGGKRRGVPVKTLKKLLKKAGLKVSGKKAALTRRAKKAKLMMKGGVTTEGMDKPGMSSADSALDQPLEIEDDTTPPPPPPKAGRKSKSRGKKGMGMYGY
jgi:hypothetical protein